MQTKNSEQTDRRLSERFELEIKTEVCISNDCITLVCGDISENGIFLKNDGSQLPDVGTIVSVRPESAPASSAMAGKVVRTDGTGIAIQFSHPNKSI